MFWRRSIFTLQFSLLVSFLGYSQIEKPVISVESGVEGGFGKYAPFWLTANKFGIYSFNKNQGYARASIIKDYSRKIDYYYGLDLMDRYDVNNNFFIKQAYAGFKLFSIHIKGGIKEDLYGNQNPLLSSGGALWSGNARPIPQIYAGIPEYITVPFTRNLLEIKGGISHGWFGETDQYVKNAYLHFKYFFFRIGSERFKFHAGLYHAAMWGGTSSDKAIGKLPEGFKDYLAVVLVKGDDNSNLPAAEQINQYGNHVASYQFGIDYLGEHFDYILHYQTFLEDKNGRVIYFSSNGIIRTDWENKPDMIIGLTIKNKNNESFFQSALIEYTHTSQQSGDPLKSGNDNYANNYLYSTGWTYYNMTISTPLITSPAYFHGLNNNSEYILNNCVIAFHNGFEGKIKNNFFIWKATYSYNKGTISIPFPVPKNQFSFYLGYSYLFKNYNNLSLGIESGLDLGSLIGNNAGLRLYIKKIL